MTFNLTSEEIEFMCEQASRAYNIAFSKNISLEEIKDFLFEIVNEEIVPEPYELKLYECAKSDFKAMKLLRASEDYALATYHLQQAVEKLTKTFGLYTGQLTYQELVIYDRTKKNKVVGHITPKMFVILLGKENLAKRIEFFFSASGRKVKIEEQIKNLNNLISKPQEISKIPKNEIIKAISIYRDLYKKIRTENKRGLKGRLDHFAISFQNGLKSKFNEEKIGYISKLNKHMNLISLRNLDVPFIFMNLAILSIITYPHCNNTRYPKFNENNLEPIDYNLSLGIVQALPEIEDFLERIFKRSEQIFKKSSLQNQYNVSLDTTLSQKASS